MRATSWGFDSPSSHHPFHTQHSIRGSTLVRSNGDTSPPPDDTQEPDFEPSYDDPQEPVLEPPTDVTESSAPSQEKAPKTAPPTKGPTLSVRVVLLTYGALLVVAIGWGWLTHGPNVFFLPASETLAATRVLRIPGLPAWAFRYGGALVVGLTLGLVVVGASRLGVRYSNGLRGMQEAFASTLGEMSGAQVWVAAVASAVAEEALFRGAMLPTIGIWWSSAVFGILHTPMERRMRLWPVMAFVMGVGFALSAMAFGHLLAPMVAHFTINFLNLKEISREATRLKR